MRWNHGALRLETSGHRGGIKTVLSTLTHADYDATKTLKCELSSTFVVASDFCTTKTDRAKVLKLFKNVVFDHVHFP